MRGNSRPEEDMSTIYRSCLITLIALIILSSFPVLSYAAPMQPSGLPSNSKATSPTATLRVGNDTGAVLPKLVLTGPKTYVFYNLPASSHSDFVIEKGRYRIEYTSCGIKRSFMVDIKADLQRLRIEKCKMAKISVFNHTGGDMNLSLSGPTAYRFNLPPGNTRLLVIQGTFRYNMSALCGSKSGRLEVRKRIQWIWTCPQPNALDVKNKK
jgi:hypothetical protein